MEYAKSKKERERERQAVYVCMYVCMYGPRLFYVCLARSPESSRCIVRCRCTAGMRLTPLLMCW